jgi:ATP-binding cassette subfamily B multidrug efflux pump
MRGRTSFIIAHRLSTIRDADMVLVVDAGRIVERGTPDELASREGYFKKLYDTQRLGIET